MITPEVILYIKQQRSTGMLPHNIKLSLQANGWQEVDILEAFKQAGVEMTTEPAAVPNSNQPVNNGVSATPAKLIETAPRPVPVTILGVLQYISGVFSLLGVALIVFGGVILGSLSGSVVVSKIAINYSFYIAAAVLAMSIVSFTAGHGLFKGRNYGRFILAYLILISPITQIIFSANITAALKNISAGLGIGIIILAYLFGSKKSNAFFKTHSSPDSFRSSLIVTLVVLFITTAGVFAVKANIGPFLEKIRNEINQDMMEQINIPNGALIETEDTQSPETIETTELETL